MDGVPNRNNRILEFDILKTIAIIGIVVTHSSMSLIEGEVGKIAQAGARCVQLFFIISAYLMCESLKRNKKELKFWYIKKVFRLVPLFWVSSIVYIIINGLGETYWTYRDGLTWGTIISNFCLFHGINPFWINAININWYVGTLVIFIILSPLLTRIITSFRVAVIWFVLCYIITDFVTKQISLLSVLFEKSHIWVAYWGSFSFITELPVYVLGIVLFYYMQEGINKTLWFSLDTAKRGYMVALLIGSVISFFQAIRENYSIVGYSLVFILIIITALVCNIGRYMKGFTPIFVMISENTYGIYLFHRFFQSFYKMYVKTDGLLVSCVEVIASLMASLLCSALLSHIIEKPVCRFLDGLICRLSWLWRKDENSN